MSPIWSVIANRKDKANQQFWTEYRQFGVSVGGTPAQAGYYVVLDENGLIDESLLLPITGAGVNKVTALITFGINYSGTLWHQDTTASVTVTGQAWVRADSVVIAGFGGTTANHGPDDALAEGLTAYVKELQPGIGFTITSYAPHGSWGTYQVWALGIA